MEELELQMTLSLAWRRGLLRSLEGEIVAFMPTFEAGAPTRGYALGIEGHEKLCGMLGAAFTTHTAYDSVVTALVIPDHYLMPRREAKWTVRETDWFAALVLTAPELRGDVPMLTSAEALSFLFSRAG